MKKGWSISGSYLHSIFCLSTIHLFNSSSFLHVYQSNQGQNFLSLVTSKLRTASRTLVSYSVDMLLSFIRLLKL